MRSLTTDAQNAITAGVVTPFYMVAIAFASGTYRAWTGVNTVVWNSHEWTGLGDFLGVSSITQTSDLSAEGITVSLSGLNADDVSSMIGEAAQNTPLDVYLGFMSGGSIVVDPVHCFSGALDVPTLQDDGATATISVTGENALIKLSRASARRYTNDDQAIDYPTDTGFQYVPLVQLWDGSWGGKNGGNTSNAPGNNQRF
jgi:hypothetical protein